MDSLTYSFCLVKYEYILFSFLPGFILGVFHKSASFPFLAPNIDKTKPYSCIDKTKPNSCILFVCDILSNILDCFFHCPNIKMYCGYYLDKCNTLFSWYSLDCGDHLKRDHQERPSMAIGIETILFREH
jgi:hypothetical protein